MKDSITNAIIFSSGVACGALILSQMYYKDVVSSLNAKVEKTEQTRKSERLGRLKAEKQLRDALKHSESSGPSEALPVKEGERELLINNSSYEVKTDEVDLRHVFKSIATVHSSFRDLQGTPRQPHLAPATKAQIVFEKHIAPGSVEDIDSYSHIWVLFVFHENTNVNKVSSLKSGNESVTFPAKVFAPRANGKKVGLFSTRTPHRPNPIGLTLAKVDKVVIEGNSKIIHISGGDLLHGTPVLDVKPYLPYFESKPDAVVPSWVAEESPVREVVFTEQAIQDLRKNTPYLKFYKSFDEIYSALFQVLSVDVSRKARESPYNFRFDKLVVEYYVTADDTIKVAAAPLGSELEGSRIKV